jgi:hypothetical protein
MKAPVAIFCALLVAGISQADPYNIVKQQAHRASDQNTAEQQRIQNAAGGPAQPGAASPAPAPNAPPMDPMLQATLNNINNLQADFAVFISSTSDKPDPAQKVSLLNNLSTAAQGKKAPSDSVKKLADDLMGAISGKKKLAPASQKKLAAQVHAIFNSAHLTDAQQKTMFDDVQKILTEAGATLDDAVNVVTDLKKIAEATK